MKNMALLPMLILSLILVGSSLLANQAPSNTPRVKKPSPKQVSKPSAKPQTKVRSFAIDVPGSRIGFVVKSRLMTVDTIFTSWTGKLSMDPANLTRLSLTLNVASTSIDTGSGLKDKEIKGKNFFDVEKYPKIKLVSKQVTSGGPRTVPSAGQFHIKDITKTVTIPLTVQVNGSGRH